MPEPVSLHDLVGTVAASIVDAQGQVERHFIDRISHYFDAEGRPLSLALKMPRPSTIDAGEYMQVAVPLLSLVESNMLAIRDLKIELDVELGSVSSNPAAPASNPPAAPAAPPRTGAPIDVPLAGRQPEPAPAAAPAPQGAAAMAAPAPVEKMLMLGIGSRQDSGPRARLTINVAAQQPSEGMMRLLTQLNKLV